MYRTLAGLLGVAAGAVLLAGLSFSASSSKRADLRILNAIEPESLDPQQLTATHTARLAQAIFEGLTRYDAPTLQPAPGVAEHWEISEDGTRYTFHVRPGSHWSDGVPITAEDFVYSWRHLLAPATGSRNAYMLHPVRGAKEIHTFAGLAEMLEGPVRTELAEALRTARSAPLTAEAWRALTARAPLHESLSYCSEPLVRSLLDEPPGPVPLERLEGFSAALAPEAQRLRAAAADASSRFGKSLGVYAEDPHTLIVELEAPTPYFLDLTSHQASFAVPRHVVEKFGRSWFLPEHIVTNGAFRLEAWRVNDRIRLRKDPTYWGRDEVHAETIDLYPTENVTTALNLYLTHEADWLPSYYPSDLVQELRTRPDFYVHPALGTYYYRINTRRPPLNDARVRQAISLAIDRPLIVAQVLGRGEAPATRFVPPGIPKYEPPQTELGLDVERARQLLADAGYPGGRGFPKIGIVFNTLDVHEKVASVIADHLRKNLGIEIAHYNQEWQSYLATVRSGDYDLARSAWIGDYVDPNSYLDMWVTNGGNNQTGFSSPTYDALLRAAANVLAFADAPGPLLSRLKQPEPIRALLARRAASHEAAERRALLDETRMRLLGEAEAILVQEEFPIIPIFYYVNHGLISPKLKGFFPWVRLPDGTLSSNLQPIHPLRDLWAEP